MLVSTQIHRLPERDTQTRLTIRDRLQLHSLGERITAAGFDCIIGRDADAACGHDFVQLNARADGVATWTFVRSGELVTVWHGTHGPDLGSFPTLGVAIGAALATAPYSYRRTFRQPPRRTRNRAADPARMDEGVRAAAVPAHGAGPGPVPGH